MAKSKPKIELDSWTDRNGNVVRVGDGVVYGNSIGRCAKTAFGIVQRIAQTPEGWGGEGQKWKVVIQVLSIQDEHIKYRDATHTQSVWLQEVDRILWYPKDKFGLKFQNLLFPNTL